MTRHPDWRQRLTAYLRARAGQPYRPGRHDCALFAAGAVEAMTGVDLARGWRGYRTLAEGRRKLADGGHAGLGDLCAAHFEAVAPLKARPGDVALVPLPDGGEALGIVQGSAIYLVTPQGLGLLPLTAAARVFRV